MADETGIQDESTDLRECVHFPMRVQQVATRAASSATLIALAKERAPDPSVFDDAEPHLFTGIVSTLAVDSYFTHMAPSSLTNFAQDMEQGVALQDSHSTYRLSLGRSLTGRSIRGKGELPTRTEGEFFMLPNSSVSGMSTDDVMRNIRAGSLTDLSVGMSAGTWICDICGGNLARWSECPHWPGQEYTPEGKDQPVVATATIHEARLAEVSLVYSGSTPGAVIQKVIRAVAAGQLEPEKVRVLETCYRMKLPGSRHIYPVTPHEPPAALPASSAKPEGTMPETPTGTPPPAERSPEMLTLLTRAREVVGIEVAAGAQPPTDEAVMERLLAQAGRVPELDKRVAELVPQAKDGEAYRAAMVDAAWTEYVRAGLAEGVVEADQRALWAGTPLAQLLKEQSHYRKLGDARLGNGRQTSEGEAAAPAAPQFAVPAYLYAA